MLLLRPLGLLLLPLVLRWSAGTRSAEDVAELLELEGAEAQEKGSRSVAAAAKEICGGTEIWFELAGAGQALVSAKNTNWARIEALQQEHIRGQRAKQESREKSLEALSQRLRQALKDERLPGTAERAHRALVEAGVRPSFRGVIPAKDWRCGKRQRGEREIRPPKWIRGAFDKSLDAFREASSELFGEKAERLDGDRFLRDCRDLLVAGGEGEGETHCFQLCQQFKDIADSHSHRAVGEVAKTSAKLKDEIREATEALAEVKASIEECETDSSGLSAFRSELEGLRARGDRCHGALREAETGLVDLEWDIEDLREEMDALEAALQVAMEKLSNASAAVRESLSTLEAAAEKEQALQQSVTELQQELTALREDLEKARRADLMLWKLKEHVTGTMMWMAKLADAALREPLLNLGFSEDPEDVRALFPDPESTGAAVMAKDAIATLQLYCKETALPAFTELKNKVGLDMTRLCAFDSSDAIFRDLTEVVSKRSKKVQKQLQDVVSWLNPWRAMKKLSMEKAKEREGALVDEGQLAYLEQVRSIYYDSAFFKYLIEWRKKGRHQRLSAGLRSAVAALQQREATFQERLEESRRAWREATEARQAALEALEQAKKDEGVAAEERASLEEALADLKAKGEKMEQDLSQWLARVQKAEAELKRAEAALLDAYKEGPEV